MLAGPHPEQAVVFQYLLVSAGRKGATARTSTLDLMWVPIGLSELTKRDVWSLHDMNALGWS